MTTDQRPTDRSGDVPPLTEARVRDLIMEIALTRAEISIDANGAFSPALPYGLRDKDCEIAELKKQLSASLNRCEPAIAARDREIQRLRTALESFTVPLGADQQTVYVDQDDGRKAREEMDAAALPTPFQEVPFRGIKMEKEPPCQ